MERDSKQTTDMEIPLNEDDDGLGKIDTEIELQGLPCNVLEDEQIEALNCAADGENFDLESSFNPLASRATVRGNGS